MDPRQSFAWEAQGRRFTPRLMVCIRVTDLEGELAKWLKSDVNDIDRAIELVSEQRPVDWDTIVATRDMAIPKFPKNPTEAERARARMLVLEKNRSAVEHSDCFIGHAWSNGSTMLGDNQRAFLEGPIVRPSIMLRHKDNHGVSLAWHAMADEHPQLKIIDFDEDLVERLRDHLQQIADDIERSALARQDLEAKWRPVCNALATALKREDQAVRGDLAKSLGRSVPALHALVTSPMQLAGLSTEHSDRIRARYGDIIRRTILAESAAEYFSRPELNAYNTWSNRQPRSRALTVLEKELKVREEAGVYNPRPQRRTPESWEILAGGFGV